MISIGEYLESIRDDWTVVRPRPGNARIDLPNGWSVSVAYHRFAYSDNRILQALPPTVEPEEAALGRGKTAEIAIFRPDGAFFAPHCDPGEESATVWGYLNAREIDAVVETAATMPPQEEPAFCPCPDCVRATAGVAS